MRRKILDDHFNNWEENKRVSQGMLCSDCPIIAPEDSNVTFPEKPLPACFTIHYDGKSTPNCDHFKGIIRSTNTNVFWIDCNKDKASYSVG